MRLHTLRRTALSGERMVRYGGCPCVASMASYALSFGASTLSFERRYYPFFEWRYQFRFLSFGPLHIWWRIIYDYTLRRKRIDAGPRKMGTLPLGPTRRGAAGECVGPIADV